MTIWMWTGAGLIFLQGVGSLAITLLGVQAMVEERRETGSSEGGSMVVVTTLLGLILIALAIAMVWAR